MTNSTRPKNTHLTRQKLNEYFWLGACLVVGFSLRFYYVSGNEFPLNDGGMFYQVIQDVIVHKFHFFPTLTYNFSNIPFAYPPLPFYFAAGLHSILDIDIIVLLKYIPILFSGATIAAAYVLLTVIGIESRQKIIALAFYAVLPSNTVWFIMGGGLTRAMGLFFALCASTLAIRYLKNKKLSPKTLMLSAILIAVTVLSHLEALVFLVLVVAVWVFVYAFNWQSMRRAVFLALFSMVLVAPWVVAVVNWHGLVPFTTVFFANFRNTGFGPLNELVAILTSFQFTIEGEVKILSALVLIGLVYSLYRKLYYPILLLASIALFMNRSALSYLVLPLCVLTAYALETLRATFTNTTVNQRDIRNVNILVFVVMVMYVSSVVSELSTSWYTSSMGSEEQVTMDWISSNLPEDARFLIVTSRAYISWSVDHEAEWFPAIAKRHAVNTVQGTEWIPGKFYSKLEQTDELSKCGAHVECYDDVVSKYNDHFRYIYISNNAVLQNALALPNVLVNELRRDNDFEKIYTSESGSVSVWEKKETYFNQT